MANYGELNAPAAIKGAHFIRQCDIRDIPMLFLQHTPSDKEFISQTGNAGVVAKARAQMMTTLAASKVFNTIHVHLQGLGIHCLAIILFLMLGKCKTLLGQSLHKVTSIYLGNLGKGRIETYMKNHRSTD